MKLEQVLKRDKIIVLSGLFIVVALCWSYLAHLVLDMNMGISEMPMESSMSMLQIHPWSAVDFWLMFVMWAVMMVGMMLPSATPMILFFSAFNRKLREQGHPFVRAGVFISGYLIMWSVFSVAAVLLQWQFDQAALLSPMMVSTSPMLGGVILIAAGVFQLTPLKHVCLKHCRSPVQFISSSWRKGTSGALIMGLQHGTYCLGCCWVLMLLLFFGGVMNLLWIGVLSIFVLLEKVLPAGVAFGRISGFLLLITGLLVITQTVPKL